MRNENSIGVQRVEQAEPFLPSASEPEDGDNGRLFPRPVALWTAHVHQRFDAELGPDRAPEASFAYSIAPSQVLSTSTIDLTRQGEVLSSLTLAAILALGPRAK